MAGSTQQDDIKRYTMQSFVGSHLSTMQISHRQKEAIERLVRLTDDKFDGLCEDIVSEIHRRNGIQNSTENTTSPHASPVHDRLAQLSEDKFKNLVVDVLLVHSYKQPNSEPLKLDQFMNNLQHLIAELNGLAENERFINKIKDLTFLNKLEEYNKYIKERKRVPNEITDEIEKAIKEEKSERSGRLLDVLAYPDVLIEELNKVKENEEIKKSKEKIRELMNGEKNEEEIKENIIKIIREVMGRMVIPARRVEAMKEELEIIVEVLEEIEKDMKGTYKVKLNEMSKRISGALNTILETMKGREKKGDKAIINELAVQKVFVDELDASSSKMDAFQHVLKLAKAIRKGVES